MPLNFAYALQADGQGIQVFAGPYFGLLLGGNYSYDDRRQLTTGGVVMATSTDKCNGDITGGNYYSTSASDTKFYSRSVDAGLQFGLGYRKNGFLLQAGYSMGLRNLGADYKFPTYGTSTQTVPGPSYYNRAFQLSLSYLVGQKS